MILSYKPFSGLMNDYVIIKPIGISKEKLSIVLLHSIYQLFTNACETKSSLNACEMKSSLKLWGSSGFIWCRHSSELLVEQRGVAVAVKFYLCYGTSWIMIDTNQIN